MLRLHPVCLVPVLVGAVFVGVSRARAQCTEISWGGVGAGANAGQAYTSTFAVAGMGTRMMSLSTPTTGGVNVYAQFDIGKEIRKVRALGGGTAWCTDGTTIWAFNALNAASNPLRLQSTFTPSGGVRDFVPVGLTLYCWNGTTLSVIDYTNAATPSLISSITLPNAPFEASFLNNRLYLLSSGRTVQILDVTDPANPAFIRSLSLGGNATNSVLAPYAFSGGGSLVHFAFYQSGIIVGSNVLRVVSIDNDLLTGAAGSVSINGSIAQISGNLLIKSDALQSINWANPLAPVLTNIYIDPTSRFRSFGTSTSGGITRAYIAGGEGGFSVVNVNSSSLQGRLQSSPAAATETAFVPGTGNLYTASGLNGLLTETVTDLGPLSRQIFPAGSNSGTGTITQVACGANFAAVTGGTNVTVISTADVFVPSISGTYVATGAIEDIAASGSAGFVVRNVSGARQLDMVNMSVSPPALQASLPLPNDFTPFRRVRATGAVVAVVVSSSACHLFTFAAPSASGLAARGVISLPGAGVQDAAITGNFLYLLDSAGLIRAYDITNPDAPAPIASVPCPAGLTAMALGGDWIAAVGSGTMLQYINISNRSNPVALATAMLPMAATNLCATSGFGASGPQFAVACGSCGVRMYGPPLGWTPAITDQPDDTSACPGGTAVFTVGALAPSIPLFAATYQWHRGIGNGGDPIPGATGPTLTLTNVSAADAAVMYSCAVTNSCGSAISEPASLQLCRVDINCSGTVSVQDIFDFLSLFFSENAAADFNGTNGLTVQDLFDFLAAYFAGCA